MALADEARALLRQRAALAGAQRAALADARTRIGAAAQTESEATGKCAVAVAEATMAKSAAALAGLSAMSNAHVASAAATALTGVGGGGMDRGSRDLRRVTLPSTSPAAVELRLRAEIDDLTREVAARKVSTRTQSATANPLPPLR